MLKSILCVSTLIATAILGLPATTMAQKPIGRAMSSWVCTERGAVAVLRGFSFSVEKAGEVINGPECIRFPDYLPLQVVAVGMGPVKDYEGDTAYVVEVMAPPNTLFRYTVAWPGVSASIEGLGQGA